MQPEPHITNTNFIKFLIGKLDLKGTPETPKLWHSVGSADEELVLGQKAQKCGVET